nr:unnamed protein product [Callosobruchus chinensis]
MYLFPQWICFGDVHESPKRQNVELEEEEGTSENVQNKTQEIATNTNPSTMTRRKRTSKSKRLEHSLKVSDKLVEVEQAKAEAMTKYYEAKSNYLSWRQKYEEEKLNCIKQTAELQGRILEEIKDINSSVSKYIDLNSDLQNEPVRVNQQNNSQVIQFPKQSTKFAKGNLSEKSTKICGTIRRKWIYVGRITGRDVTEEDVRDYLKDLETINGYKDIVVTKLNTHGSNSAFCIGVPNDELYEKVIMKTIGVKELPYATLIGEGRFSNKGSSKNCSQLCKHSRQTTNDKK